MRTLKLKYNSLLQGDFKLGKLNFLYTFQVNCPGCFFYGFPVVNELFLKHKDKVNFLGLLTAFEDKYKEEFIRFTKFYNTNNLLSKFQELPEEVKENNYSETKEIEDGFDYELDANGNVKKDTAGNDIKIIKYKTIRCNVKELHQFKTARISGTIDYLDNYNNKLLKRPIGMRFGSPILTR